MATDQRRIVVVGAGSGIGAATAAHFHEQGDHVLAVDLRPDRAEASAHAQCDLRDATQINKFLGSIGGGWDLLAYVAGCPEPHPPPTS